MRRTTAKWSQLSSSLVRKVPYCDLSPPGRKSRFVCFAPVMANKLKGAAMATHGLYQPNPESVTRSARSEGQSFPQPSTHREELEPYRESSWAIGRFSPTMDQGRSREVDIAKGILCSPVRLGSEEDP